MKIVENEKLLYVDTDDTIGMWNLSDYPAKGRVYVSCYNHITTIVPNQKNINLVKKFIKLGYGIVAWSATGAEWAKAVFTAVGLDEYVTIYLTKPRYYLDDVECTEWMGQRIYRDNKEE